MIRRLSAISVALSLAFAFVPAIANAQIQNEPVDVVTASVPSTFSERAGFWPTEEIGNEQLKSDSSTLNDRWNSVPGIQARENGSPTFSIRGSAQADRVLKLFDGSPLNMADGVGGSDLLIPTEIMSNVALIKGPASVFYGTSAMAGAVDHRLRFYDDPTFSGTLGEAGGLLAEKRAALIVPLANKKTQVSVFAEQNPQSWLYQSTTTNRNGRNDGNAKSLYRATAASDLHFGSTTALNVRAVVAKSTGDSSGSLYFPIHSTIDQTASLISLELKKQISSTVQASAKLLDTRIWGLYDDGTISQSTSFTTRTSLFADVNVALNDSLLLKSFTDTSLNSLAASYVGSSRYYETDFDIGQTLEASITPQISLQPGYRYQSRYGQFFKSLAAIFSSSPSTFALKLGEGYRAPSLSDRFGNFSTFIANPSLKAERSWTSEISWNYEPGRRFSGFLKGYSSKASLYYTNYSDLVDTLTTGGTFTKINSGEARAYGSELSVAYGYRVWMFSAAYNYLNAKSVSSGEPLRLSPEHQTVFSVAQIFGPLLIEAKDTLWSPFYDRDPATGLLKKLDAWNTLDLTFRTLALTNWEFRGGIYNLFDVPRELTIGYPEPQRRLYVSAERSF